MANWNDTEKARIWDKAERCGIENEKNGFRKDQCGAWIKFSEYGNRNSKYGWEIDHVYPESRGGDDRLENLRPMQWENNVIKNDDFPDYETAVIAQGGANIRKKGHYTVNSTLREQLQQLYHF